MSKKRRKNNLNKMTNHHIIPRSRAKSSDLENIARVKNRDHQFYHSLFENKKPNEIVEYLVNDFWNGNWDYVKEAYDSNN